MQQPILAIAVSLACLMNSHGDDKKPIKPDRGIAITFPKSKNADWVDFKIEIIFSDKDEDHDYDNGLGFNQYSPETACKWFKNQCEINKIEAVDLGNGTLVIIGYNPSKDHHCPVKSVKVKPVDKTHAELTPKIKEHITKS